MLNLRRTNDPTFNCTTCKFSKREGGELKCFHAYLMGPGAGAALLEADKTDICDRWTARQGDEDPVLGKPPEIPESMRPMNTDQMHDFVAFITHSIKMLYEDPRIDWESAHPSHLSENLQALIKGLSITLNALLRKGYEYKLETHDHLNVTGKVDAIVIGLDVFKTTIQRP